MSNTDAGDATSDAAAESAASLLAAGDSFTCVLRPGGTVACWGRNDSGQLGNGTKTDSSTPVGVMGVSDAVAVAAGANHACALSADGSVECWGANYYGQLGDGTTTSSSVAVAVLRP